MTTELQVEEPEVVDLCADTVRMRVLPESALPADVGSHAAAPSFDPYRSGTAAPAVRPTPRRTLDDMRRLSAAIVRSRLAAK